MLQLRPARCVWESREQCQVCLTGQQLTNYYKSSELTYCVRCWAATGVISVGINLDTYKRLLECMIKEPITVSGD